MSFRVFAILQASEYSVCKMFLDDLLKVIRGPDLDHIFAHGYEQVNVPLAYIIWKCYELYRNIAILIGGFDELRVRQKNFCQRHVLRGYQKRVIDPKTIVLDSSDTTLERRHYYKSIKINKELFVPQYNIGL